LKRAFVLAVLLAGCMPVTGFVRLNSSPRPLAPRPPSEVELFTTSAPTREYVEVAILTASPGPGMYWGNGIPLEAPSNLIASLRKQGAQVGCDGLIVRPGAGHSYQGTCVVYR
jgi:hypothetical protein